MANAVKGNEPKLVDWTLKQAEKKENKGCDCCKTLGIAAITAIGTAIAWAVTKADDFAETRIARVAESVGVAPGLRSFSGVNMGAQTSSTCHDLYKTHCASVLDNFPECLAYRIGAVAGLCLIVYSAYHMYCFINHANKRYEEK